MKQLLIGIIVGVVVTAAWGMSGQAPAPKVPQFPLYNYSSADPSVDFTQLNYFSVDTIGSTSADATVKQLVIQNLTDKGYQYQPGFGRGGNGFHLLVQVTTEVKEVDTMVSKSNYGGTQRFLNATSNTSNQYVNTLLNRPLARRKDSTLSIDSIFVTAYRLTKTGASEIWHGGSTDFENPGFDYAAMTELALRPFPSRK